MTYDLRSGTVANEESETKHVIENLTCNPSFKSLQGSKLGRDPSCGARNPNPDETLPPGWQKSGPQ